MLRKIVKREPTKLNLAIDAVYDSMSTLSPGSPEYKEQLANLEKLDKMRNETRRRVSPDTWVQAGFGFLGIVVIVAYEQKHVLASKAMSLLKGAK